MPIQIYSFFSGLGLLDLGFEDAGFDIAFVNEYNKQFLESYQYARHNRNHIPYYGYRCSDIRIFLDDKEWENSFPDYQRNNDQLVGFIGGPPCPDYSVAGTNKGEKGENGQLTTVYIRLIQKRRPDFFVLENVKGLVSTTKHKEYYKRMKRSLYRSGYSLFDSVENALLYGAPQNRDRLFLIGFKRETFGARLYYQFGGHRTYTFEQIRSGDWPTTDPFVEGGVLAQPKNIIEELAVEYWFKRNHVYEHPNSKDAFKARSQERFVGIPEGNTGGKSFKRLHRWRFAPTAAFGNNEVHLHPYYPRRLSVAEALAIQSAPAYIALPDDLPLSVKFKMVGNGVPYLMALGIAQDLYEWIRERINR